MSNYSTLLGSYRMSASTQVLPPPSSNNTTARRYADGSSSSSSYFYDNASSSSSSAAFHRTGAAARVYTTSASNNSGVGTATVTRPRSSAPSSSSSTSKLASTTAAAANNRNYYYQEAAAPSTTPQSYLSTSSSSSSSSSHYYYQQQQKTTSPYVPAATPQKKHQEQQQSSSSSSSASILTQAQRTSGGSTSSKNANVINNAHHHRLRSSMYKPKWDPALPRTRYSHRPLLLLDLDETLVHATTQRPSASHRAGAHDLHFHVDMGPHQAPVPVWVALRPGAKQFVYDIAAYFEIAVFTASIKNYADKVCEALDPSGTLIHHRLYRDHCSDVDGVFVKDLSLLNRPLHRVSILDNSPHAYLFHPENSIPILSWFEDPCDNELQKMLPMLIHRLSQADECYGVLENYRNSL